MKIIYISVTMLLNIGGIDIKLYYVNFQTFVNNQKFT